MRLRSMLFVPGDRPDRMEKALGAGADALILDLEDAVALPRKPQARREVADFLARGDRGLPLFVRINPLEGGLADDDLAAVLPARPDGIVLPKAEGGASEAALAARLEAAGDSTARILPIATETPAAMFTLGTFGASGRLAAISWGAEDLPAAIGAATSRETDGRYTAPYELARSLTLFGAHAAGVPPLDTVFPALADEVGLAAYAGRAARDGFAGMLAIHPRQIPVIHAAFTPDAAALAHARAIIAAFAANPGAGTLAVNGRMVDAPHLKQARHLLLQAGEGAET